MRNEKRSRLESAGWRVGSAAEFLGLDEVEVGVVELRLALGNALREKRSKSGLSQAAIATRIGSSQSRVAKMEAADASVSLDLMIRTLLALRVAPREIARWIARVDAAG